MSWAAVPVLAQSSGQSGEPVAVVAGEAIHDADLLPRVSGQLQQLRQQEYQIKADALEELIHRKLLESEAARQNLTPEALLEREADGKVSAPTDAEIEAVYNAQKARINRPLEEVKPQIAQMLRESRVDQARAAFFKTLRDAADVAIYLQPPRIEVSPDPARVLGDPNAPVTIVEFSDFQCPFCQRAHPIVKQLLAKYPSQVKLAYRDFPLQQIHPEAHAAAAASRCAGEQGKFWQFHDRLFETGAPLNGPTFTDHAAQLGLDTAQFVECLGSDRFTALIEQDLEDGNRAGVNGTPAFFINGIALTGAQPLAAFEKVVEEELAAIRRAQTAP
jgi:protein-disulfide isomerase